MWNFLTQAVKDLSLICHSVRTRWKVLLQNHWSNFFCNQNASNNLQNVLWSDNSNFRTSVMWFYIWYKTQLKYHSDWKDRDFNLSDALAHETINCTSIYATAFLRLHLDMACGMKKYCSILTSNHTDHFLRDFFLIY
jgi:hypothetical protein